MVVIQPAQLEVRPAATVVASTTSLPSANQSRVLTTGCALHTYIHTYIHKNLFKHVIALTSFDDFHRGRVGLRLHIHHTNYLHNYYSSCLLLRTAQFNLGKAKALGIR